MKYIEKLLCAVLALMLMLSSIAQASDSAKINSDSARFYSSRSTSSDSVSLKKGTSVTVKSVSGDWAKASYKGVTGYVPVKYLNSSSRYSATSAGTPMSIAARPRHRTGSPSARTPRSTSWA